MKFYPVVDRPTLEEFRKLGLDLWKGESGFTQHPSSNKVRVVRTGEFRPPKAGEWYISGAIIEGYRAPNDLTQAFHIARLVRVEVKTVEVIVKE